MDKRPSDITARAKKLHRDLLKHRTKIQSICDRESDEGWRREWMNFDKGLRHALIRLEEIYDLERVTT